MSIIVNVDYLKSWNGIFKSLQLVLDIICVGIIGYHFNNYNFYNILTIVNSTKYYFLVATCFSFIGTFILFISYLMSPSAASMIPKTIYEFLYYSITSILLLAASIALMVDVTKYKNSFLNPLFDYNLLLAASICSLIKTGLYICGAVIAFSSYGDD